MERRKIFSVKPDLSSRNYLICVFKISTNLDRSSSETEFETRKYLWKVSTRTKYQTQSTHPISKRGTIFHSKRVFIVEILVQRLLLFAFGTVEPSIYSQETMLLTFYRINYDVLQGEIYNVTNRVNYHKIKVK